MDFRISYVDYIKHRMYVDYNKGAWEMLRKLAPECEFYSVGYREASPVFYLRATGKNGEATVLFEEFDYTPIFGGREDEFDCSLNKLKDIDPKDAAEAIRRMEPWDLLGIVMSSNLLVLSIGDLHEAIDKYKLALTDRGLFYNWSGYHLNPTCLQYVANKLALPVAQYL